MTALTATVRRGVASFWRHRWSFAVPVATLLLAATAYAVTLPDVFKAEAVVQVRPLRPETIDGSLPRDLGDSAEEALGLSRDRIFTRDNIRAVLPLLAKDADAYDSRVLEDASKAFDWEQVGRTTFTLGLTKPDPERAAQGVNALLEVFLEAERAERVRRAERSLAFHEGELAQAKKDYAEVDGRLTAFRTTHESTLPERKDAIQAEISRLQTEITAQAAAMGAIRSRVQTLEEQLMSLATDPLPAVVSGGVSAAEQMLSVRLGEEERLLNGLEQELAQALATKTERHPDVIRLRSAVAVHQQAVQETIQALEAERRIAQRHTTDSSQAQMERRRSSLETLKRGAEAALAQAALARETLQTRVDGLHGRLGGMAGTQALLDPLLREFDQAAKRVESRDGAATDARAAVAFYRDGDLSDVTGYRVTSYAVPPVLPSGPGRVKLMLTAIVLGLLAGYGLMLLRRHHEGATIASSEDLEGLFPSAVVIGVPLLGTSRARSWGWRLKEVGLTTYVVACVGVTVFLLAAHRGLVARPGWFPAMFGGGGA